MKIFSKSKYFGEYETEIGKFFFEVYPKGPVNLIPELTFNGYSYKWCIEWLWFLVGWNR